jgi:hypothetical protein
VKSHTNNELSIVKMFGLGKWGRSKAARAEMGSEEFIG